MTDAYFAPYCRVSTDEQRKNETIQPQIELLTRWFEGRKIPIKRWYIDDGQSGRLPFYRLPAGAQLIKDAEAGLIKGVVVRDLKRIGRRAGNILVVLELLEDMGVEVISINEPIDRSTSGGKLISAVYAGQAEANWEDIVAQLIRGRDSHASKGAWFGHVPLGYRLVAGVRGRGTLEIDDEMIPGLNISPAGIVRLIYDLLFSEGSTYKVAIKLNAMGIPPRSAIARSRLGVSRVHQPRTSLWTPGPVSQVLKNSLYKGVHTYGARSERTVVPPVSMDRAYPAIVSEEVWDRAQQALADNIVFSRRNRRYDYLLSSLLVCGICGRVYTGRRNDRGPGRNYAYYNCSSEYIVGVPPPGIEVVNGRWHCPGQPFNVDALDALVWGRVEHLLRNFEEGMELARQVIYAKSFPDPVELEGRARRCRQEIANRRLQRERVVQLLVEEKITDEDYQTQVGRINREAEFYTAELGNLEDQNRMASEAAKQLFSVREMLERWGEQLDAGLGFEERRMAVREVVKRVTLTRRVGEVGKVEIAWFLE